MDGFIDDDLGFVKVLRNARAKNVIARHRDGGFQLTVPSSLSESRIRKAFDQLKPRLLAVEAKPILKFDSTTSFRTFSFELNIEVNNVRNYYVSLKDGYLNIVCPASTDFEANETQLSIRSAIENAMRHEAKRLFGAMLREQANLHGFNFTDLKINKSRSRWGSCSSRKSINLSYYCLLLPEHLIKFVMLHELCHTIEMNHGEKFWQLLDSVTNNRAQQLTKELKASSIRW